MIIDRQQVITRAHNSLEQARISIVLLAEVLGVEAVRDLAAKVADVEARLTVHRFSTPEKEA